MKIYLNLKKKFMSLKIGIGSHGDHTNSKFNPNSEINKKNVKNLKLIQKFSIKKDKIKKNIFKIYSQIQYLLMEKLFHLQQIGK